MSTPPRSPVRMNSDRAPPPISRPRSRSESNPGSSAANPIILGNDSDDYDFTSRISNARNTGGSLFSRSSSPINASSEYDDRMIDATTGYEDYSPPTSGFAAVMRRDGGGQPVIHPARFTTIDGIRVFDDIDDEDRDELIEEAIDDIRDYYDRFYGKKGKFVESEPPPVVKVINKNNGMYSEFDKPYLLKYKEIIFPITSKQAHEIQGLLLGYKNNQPKQMGGRMGGRKSKKSKKSRKSKKSKKSKKSRKHKRTRRHK